MTEKPNVRITKAVLKTLHGESPRERLLHRLHCVTLVLGGYSPHETARLYGDSPRAIAYWIKRFKYRGIDGLDEEARPGRPPRLDAVQLKKVQTFLKRSAKKSKPVNAGTLSAFLLTKFNIPLTPRQCWRIIKKLMT